jgi:hypothetical protein
MKHSVYDQWTKHNTSYYKEFEIQHGIVYKDEDAIILFYSPLSSTIEENRQNCNSDY